MNCRVCGSELPDGAMFCGECGSSVTATLLRPAAKDPRPSDTTIIEPLPGPAVAGPVSNVRSVPVPQPAEAPSAESAPPASDSQPSAPPASDSRTPSVTAEAMDPGREQFVLTVSTGERVVIVGGGLLGRRPIAQPGESPEQLVSVADLGRSVSKTHLEFGIEAGELWICDRFSANGTVLMPPDGQPRICEPGRRYRVGRGSRVALGDQNFVVS
jgi:hypothetical protein